MRKEWIISVILIVCILVGNVWLQNKTKQSVEGMEERLGRLKSTLLEALENQQEKQEEIHKQIGEVKDYWEKEYASLTYFIEHDELEKVKTQLYQLGGNVLVEDYEQAIPNLENCSFVLQHIKEKNQLLLRNIF